MVQDKNPIESRIWSIERRQVQWPWTTLPPVSTSRHSLTLNMSDTVRDTNRDLHRPYSTVSFRMILSDLEWLSKIFIQWQGASRSFSVTAELLVFHLLDSLFPQLYCVAISKSCVKKQRGVFLLNTLYVFMYRPTYLGQSECCLI